MLIKYIYSKLLTNFVILHKLSNALYIFFGEEVSYLEISNTDRKVAYFQFNTFILCTKHLYFIYQYFTQMLSVDAKGF